MGVVCWVMLNTTNNDSEQVSWCHTYLRSCASIHSKSKQIDIDCFQANTKLAEKVSKLHWQNFATKVRKSLKSGGVWSPEYLLLGCVQAGLVLRIWKLLKVDPAKCGRMGTGAYFEFSCPPPPCEMWIKMYAKCECKCMWNVNVNVREMWNLNQILNGHGSIFCAAAEFEFCVLLRSVKCKRNCMLNA